MFADDSNIAYLMNGICTIPFITFFRIDYNLVESELHKHLILSLLSSFLGLLLV
jgi:hypothetical protein